MLTDFLQLTVAGLSQGSVYALLAIGLSEPSALGKVRYYAKKALAELARVM